IAKSFETTDVHVLGELFRFFHDPLIRFSSTDVKVKQDELINSKKHDYVLLSFEPRGHRGVNSCLIERSDVADYQLLFIPNKDANVFKLEALAASITYLVELGRIKPKEKFSIETYKGIFNLSIVYENGKVNRVIYDVKSTVIANESNVHTINGTTYKLIEKPKEVTALNVEHLGGITELCMQYVASDYFTGVDYIVLFEKEEEGDIKTIIIEKDGFIIRSPKIEVTILLSRLLNELVTNKTVYKSYLKMDDDQSVSVQGFITSS